jgi:hypothetical protein
MKTLISKLFQSRDTTPQQPPSHPFTDDELVEMWRAMAFERSSCIERAEKYLNNSVAKASAATLKTAMLKVRALADVRGVSVEFEHPAIISFSAEDWRDIPEE